MRLARLPRLRSALHCRGDFDVPHHVHDATELVFVSDGEVAIACAGHDLVGRPGSIFVLPHDVAHDQRCRHAWYTRCVLYYDGGHLLDETPRILHAPGDPLLARWTDDLCRIHESSGPATEGVADALLHALLVHVAALEDRHRDEARLHPKLAEAVRILEERLEADFDAEDLAADVGVSYSHLSALFRERFGCAPLRFHQNLRLDRAKKLLLNPYLTVEQVARQVGFADTNYFVRLFRRANGVPPGRWRRG